METIPILFFLAFGALVIVLIVAGALQSAKRKEELRTWAQSRGLRFDDRKDHSFENRYPTFQALRQGSNRYAYNIVSGAWKDYGLTAFDYHYETHSTDSKGRRQTSHHHFSAVIMRTPCCMRPLLIRPEGFFDKVKDFFGFDDIDFESAEFSRKFFVKCEDRKFAYDVLHNRTIQFLLDRPRFTVQFNYNDAFACQKSRFSTAEFEKAIETITGICDALPDYVAKESKH
ncbi:MAG: hypothetical protein ACOC2L_03920 [Candidatus Sumerlaeota bacterium]